MAEFERDIQNILKKIDNEINMFDLELSQIDSIIENDILLLIEDYKCKIDTTKIDINSILMKYKEFLKIKKLEAIQRAKAKLLAIREDIINTFPPDQLDYSYKKDYSYIKEFNKLNEHDLKINSSSNQI